MEYSPESRHTQQQEPNLEFHVFPKVMPSLVCIRRMLKLLLPFWIEVHCKLRYMKIQRFERNYWTKFKMWKVSAQMS